MMKLAKIVFCVLFLAGCTAWYISRVPAEMTPEQEMVVVAGAVTEATDCLDAAGGCVVSPKPGNADITPCRNADGICSGVASWSIDGTKNETCQSVPEEESGYFTNWDCYPKTAHSCKKTFATCVSTFPSTLGGLCTGSVQANAGRVAEQCGR